MTTTFAEPNYITSLSPEERKVRMAYIAGISYSGTTLLAFLLNAHPDCSSIGEGTGMIRGVDFSDYRCSCGELLVECAFWKAMERRLHELGYPMEIYRAGLWETHFQSHSNRYLNLALIRSLRSRFLNRMRDAVVSHIGPVRRGLERTAHLNWAFARAVLDLTGKAVFVDSAKDYVRAQLLSRLPNLDVRCIHLVRDARANAVSLMKRQSERDVGLAARQWRRVNNETDRVRRTMPADRWLRVRYSDLCADPQGVMDRISKFMGVRPAPLPGDFRAVENHIIGNSMRIKGSGQIREDRSWEGRLSEADLRVIARICGRLNREFGFGWPDRPR